ncbi:MAG: FecR family protein, partial [Verrucomicrobiae bacterium]|nr:FecR family protein [Verrucomicrobiae bacterium]
STLTRLGSNSIFTFDPEKRELNLKRGVLLFDMQKGLGGARIRTASITAAIEGTAGIVANKMAPQVICLAGLIRILGDRGQTLALLRPGDTFLNGRVFVVELRGLRGGKLLARGLPHSQKEFDDAAAKQLAEIQSGQLVGVTEQGQDLDNTKLGQPFTSGIETLRQRETPRLMLPASTATTPPHNTTPPGKISP